MSTPTDLQHFYGSARAFELANLTDDWTLVALHFTEGAWHRVHRSGLFGDGGAAGRDGVIEGLRQIVYAMDRRFDVRIPHIVQSPPTRADGAFMRFGVTFRRAGLPDLYVEGDPLVRYAGGRIASIEEWMAQDVAERAAAYVATHDAALRPAGSRVDLALSDANRRDLEAATHTALVRCYGAAKGEADVGAALAVAGEDLVMETIAFGVATRGKKEVELQLGAFFRAFPDYGVTLDGFATAPGVVTSWGTARLTFRGALFGIEPTGRTAELPVFCAFDFAHGSLARERLFFDAATLAEQIGVGHERFAKALALLGATRS
jgi:predicted ester cyclase